MYAKQTSVCGDSHWHRADSDRGNVSVFIIPSDSTQLAVHDTYSPIPSVSYLQPISLILIGDSVDPKKYCMQRDMRVKRMSKRGNLREMNE